MKHISVLFQIRTLTWLKANDLAHSDLVWSGHDAYTSSDLRRQCNHNGDNTKALSLFSQNLLTELSKIAYLISDDLPTATGPGFQLQPQKWATNAGSRSAITDLSHTHCETRISNCYHRLKIGKSWAVHDPEPLGPVHDPRYKKAVTTYDGTRWSILCYETQIHESSIRSLLPLWLF